MSEVKTWGSNLVLMQGYYIWCKMKKWCQYFGVSLKFYVAVPELVISSDDVTAPRWHLFAKLGLQCPQSRAMISEIITAGLDLAKELCYKA
jgi:hypothetical protein